MHQCWQIYSFGCGSTATITFLQSLYYSIHNLTSSERTKTLKTRVNISIAILPWDRVKIRVCPLILSEHSQNVCNYNEGSFEKALRSLQLVKVYKVPYGVHNPVDSYVTVDHGYRASCTQKYFVCKYLVA